MNGRVFDPTLGRFLSADPFIQAPGNLQSYNRYSYTLNNPLKYTDPSGYLFKWIGNKLSSFWKKNRRGLARAVFGAFGHSKTVRNLFTAAACILGGPVGCGIVTPINAYAGGASTKDALKTGARAFAGAVVGQGISNIAGTHFPINPDKIGYSPANYLPNVALNGIAGGAQGAINGNGFKSGFTGGAFGAAFKPLNFKMWGTGSAYKVHRVVTAGLIGGTGSYLSGGKFGYAAFSAGFGQWWNGEHAVRRRAQRGDRLPGQGRITLAGISEGAGYAATASLVIPGAQILTVPLGGLSLATGGVDLMLNYFDPTVTEGVEIQSAQYSLDLVTDGVARGIGALPGGRVVTTAAQVANHATDLMTSD